jgi:SAM-dependent methyltransferase
VEREAGGHIVEAILHCSNAECQREYPVIDGIPLLIGNLRHFIADNALRLLTRRDLSPAIESLIGDCCGPGSDFDTVRQQVSAYVWEHYGDFDPLETRAAGGPGTMLEALESGCALAAPLSSGPVLEVGCGPGRGSFDLAERTGEMVLGVDLHLPMLHVASDVLREGAVRYPRRRVGLVYDRREFEVRLAAHDNVDFWACDATALPFPAATFSLVVALNVLDAIHAPRELLVSLAEVLAVGGKAILTTPYDWSSGATPLEGWLGGHSQRSPAAGSSEAAVRSLLAPGGSPSAVPGLRLLAEHEDLHWNVRLHDRATMAYRLHLLAAERIHSAAASGPPPSTLDRSAS